MMMKLLSTAAAAALLFASGVNAAPASVQVGVIASFTTAGSTPTVQSGTLRPLSAYTGFGIGSSAMAAVAYEFDRINNEGSILPDTLINYSYADDQRSATTVDSAVDHVLGDAQIVLGVSTSPAAVEAAPRIAAKNSNAGTPLLSWAASADELNDKTQFPNFARVCEFNSELSVAMAYITKNQFQWNKIALLTTSDAYGASGYDGIRQAALAQNTTILSSNKLSTVTPTVIQSALDSISASGAKIVLFFGSGPDFATVATEISAKSMFNNQMVWFVSGSVVNYAFSSTQLAAWHGLIGVVPDVNTGTTAYNTWASGFINRSMNSVPELQWNGTLVSQIGYQTVFAADAARAVAYAFKALIVDQGLSTFTSAQVLTALKGVSFSGISGPISFKSNGDRASVNFMFKNLQSGVWTDILRYNTASLTLTEVGNGATVWYDGTHVVPSDHATVVCGDCDPQDGGSASALPLSFVTIAAALIVALFAQRQ